jgi:hypothetical protein
MRSEICPLAANSGKIKNANQKGRKYKFQMNIELNKLAINKANKLLLYSFGDNNSFL